MKAKYVYVRNTDTGKTGMLPEHLLDSFLNRDGRFEVLDERQGCVDCGTAPVEEIHEDEPEVPVEVLDQDEEEDA